MFFVVPLACLAGIAFADPTVSINDVLDEECGHVYAVELPEFELRYMEVAGELRLCVVTMANDLKPLSHAGAFDASYNFKLQLR